MDLLIPSTGLLFWMSLTFFVVLFILWKFGFPVITNMVAERKAQILKEAAETRDAIVEKAQDKARQEGARLLEDARVAIEQEKKAAIADIRKQVATLSVEIAEKVLRQNLKDDKAQMDLINRMLDEVSTDK